MTKKILSVLLSVLLLCSGISCLLTGPASAENASGENQQVENLPENLISSANEQTVNANSENKYAQWYVYDNGSKLNKAEFYQLDVDVAVSSDANSDAVLRFSTMSNGGYQYFADLCAVRYKADTPGNVTTAQNRIINNTNESSDNSAKVIPGTYRYTFVFRPNSIDITHLRMNVDGLNAGSVTFSNINAFPLKGTQYDDFASNNTNNANGYVFRYLVKEEGKVFLRVYGYGNMTTDIASNGTPAVLVGKKDGNLYNMYVEDGKSYSLNADIRVPNGATSHNTSSYAPTFDLFETKYTDYTQDYAKAIAATNSGDTQKYETNSSGSDNSQVYYNEPLNAYSYTWAGGNHGMKLRRVKPSGTLATLTYTNTNTGKINTQPSNSSGAGRSLKDWTTELNDWSKTVYSFTAFGQTLEETLNGIKQRSSNDYSTYLKYYKSDNGVWKYNNASNAPYALPSSKNAYVAFAMTIYMFDVVDIDSVSFVENCTLSAESDGNGTAKVSAEVADAGDIVTFTAHPYKGSRFLGWYDEEDNKLSPDLVYNHTVNGTLTLTAKFTDTNLLRADANVKWNHLAENGGWVSFDYNCALSRYGNTGFKATLPRHQYIYAEVKNLTPKTDYIMSFSYFGDAAVTDAIVVTTKSGVDPSTNIANSTYVIGTDSEGNQYTNCVTVKDISQQVNDGSTWNDAALRFTTGTDTDYYIILKFGANGSRLTEAENGKAFDVFSDLSLIPTHAISHDFEDSDVFGLYGSGGAIGVADTVDTDPAKLGKKYMTYTTTNFNGLIFEPFYYNKTDRYVISFDMKVLTYGNGQNSNGIDIKLGQYTGTPTYTGGATISSGNTDGKTNPMLITRYYENGKLFEYPKYSSEKISSVFYGRVSENGGYIDRFYSGDIFNGWQHFEIEIDNSRTDYTGLVQFGIRPNDKGWQIGIDNFKVEIMPAGTITNANKGYTGTNLVAIRKAGTNAQGEPIPQGIRVKSTIDTDLRENDMNGFKVTEYGTLAIKTTKLNGADLVYSMVGSDTYKAKVGVAYDASTDTDKVFEEHKDESGNITSVTYTGVLTGITQANYGSDYTVRGYMVLENNDGRRLVLYGNSITVSIYGVVYDILTNPKSESDRQTAQTLKEANPTEWQNWLTANNKTEPSN